MILRPIRYISSFPQGKCLFSLSYTYTVFLLKSRGWSRKTFPTRILRERCLVQVHHAHPRTNALTHTTRNFGDILAGYFAKRMGLPVSKLIIACNENDILHRFLQTGTYEKNPVHGAAAAGGLPQDGATAHPEGVKETLSPSMDILVSSNFERLLWFVAHDVYSSKTNSAQEKREIAGRKVKEWQTQLKTNGGFSVEQQVLDAVRADFAAERVSDAETTATIRDVYRWPEGYILDPHSAIAVTAALRSTEGAHQVALATAHPAKFAKAVEMALVEEKGFRFQDILPMQFVGLEERPRRVRCVRRSEGVEGLRKLIVGEVDQERAKA